MLFPTLLLIIYFLLVGESMVTMTGTDNLDGLVPMRALAQGNSALWPLMLTFAWTPGFAAVFGPLAVRNYRRAAESG